VWLLVLERRGVGGAAHGHAHRHVYAPVVDVEDGLGTGGAYGYGQVDGVEAGREWVWGEKTGGLAWPFKRRLAGLGSGECRMRRRGELRVSSEGECPV